MNSIFYPKGLLAALCVLCINIANAQTGNVGIDESNPASKLSTHGNMSIGATYSRTCAPVSGVIIEGRVGIGTAVPDTNAVLDLSSTTKGMLLPRMSRAQRMAIINAPKGMIVFDTDSNVLYYKNATAWCNLVSLDDANNLIGAATVTSSGTSGGWSLTGNAGTSAAVNFIGTSDNKPLIFKANNQQAGKIDIALNNAMFGYTAGNAITTGNNNTAVGTNSMKSTTIGAANTAIGTASMYANNSGSSNCALGSYTLQYNTSGSSNTAMGYAAVGVNTTGTGNTGFGAAALASNTTGINNTGLGNGALQFMTSGNNNTAVGPFSMQYVTTGGNNVSVGYGVLAGTTTGGYNTSIGNSSGATNTTGSNNTFVGNNADASSAALNNATAIGYNAKVGASNAIVLGASGTYVGINSSQPGNYLEINSGTGGSSGLRLKMLPQGALLFMSGSSDVTQSNQNLFFDATNYRLGIAAGTTPNSTIQIGGSISLPIVTKTASYTASVNDYTILCNNTSGPITINLPAVAGCTGRIYVIKKISASGTNSIIIDPSSSELIEGILTNSITAQYASITVQSDGTSWQIIGKN